jgi:hypothetical protein
VLHIIKQLAKNYNHENGNQNWYRAKTDWEYSPIFIDLIDKFNQQNQYYSSVDLTLPKDRVTGYTLASIQNNILKNSRTIANLRTQTKLYKPSGITDTNIDELFQLY